MKYIIDVKALCGEYCIDENDVTNLADAITLHLKSGDPVELNFQEVDTVLTAFFNGLFGQLFKVFDSATLESKIAFVENTPESIRSRYGKSFQNAKAFYNSPANVQQVIRKKIDRLFKEIEVDE